MQQYETRQDLADKVEWEGGVAEAILDYGILPAELPPDTPMLVRSAWINIRRVKGDVTIIERWLDDDGH